MNLLKETFTKMPEMMAFKIKSLITDARISKLKIVPTRLLHYKKEMLKENGLNGRLVFYLVEH